MTGDRAHRAGVSSPRRAWTALATAFLACVAWTPACSAEQGPPLYEMPAWAALAVGVLEALIVLAGLVAAVWTLTRSSGRASRARDPSAM